jgi:putative DNA primase/helicase
MPDDDTVSGATPKRPGRNVAAVRKARRGALRAVAGSSSGGGAGDGDLVELVDPKAPLAIARRVVARCFTHQTGGWATLRFWRGDFWQWTDAGWRLFPEQAVHDFLYAFLERCKKRDSDGRAAPCHPNARFVRNVADALRSVPPPLPVPMAEDTEPPCWLVGEGSPGAELARDQPPAAEMIPVANGVLHAPIADLWPPTPAFFAPAVSPVPWQFTGGEAPPEAWCAFLNELFPGDMQAIDLLQEWFGLCLTADTSFQKILMMIGPKRSGKGTIVRVLMALLGRGNVEWPTLASLAGDFGLAPLIGRTLAVVGDARLGRRVDQAAIVERLLGISGEDSVTIDRKHQVAWSGRLGVRFMLLTNELPNLRDASGAFSSRLILLHLSRSFFGNEDRGLEGRLLAELPAILRWAVFGWQRLQKRGYFVQPASGADTLETMHAVSSDIAMFVEDCCAIGLERRAIPDELHAAYMAWRKDQGIDGSISKIEFGKKLRSVCPGVRIAQRRQGGDSRTREYAGIALKNPLACAPDHLAF